MVVPCNTVTFSPEHVFKYLKASKKLDIFEYIANSDPKPCILGCLKEYL